MFLNFSFCCGYGEERLESEIQQESPLCENFDSGLTYIRNLWRQKSKILRKIIARNLPFILYNISYKESWYKSEIDRTWL